MAESVDEDSSKHPLWSYSGLSDDELKSILSDPDKDQFIDMAARLLESSLDVDEVFEYLDPEIFAERFDRIEQSMGQGKEAKKHRRFWRRMANQGKQQFGIEDSQPEKQQSGDVASASAERIGRRIRKIRHREDISQGELADRLNVSPSVISRLENGKHNPSFEMIKRVLNAMGYKPNIQIVPIKNEGE